MTFGPNPGIWADAVRKALNPSDEHAARVRETGAEQTVLDKAELRELELSEVYGEPSHTAETHPADRPSRLRSLLGRMFRGSA